MGSHSLRYLHNGWRMDVIVRYVKGMECVVTPQPEGKEMTIQQLYAGALGAIGDLWSYGVSVVEASGEPGAHLSWGIKKAQRIWFKLSTKYGGDLSRCRDVARLSEHSSARGP